MWVELQAKNKLWTKVCSATKLPLLLPTQPPNPCVRLLWWGQSGRGVKLATRLHPVPWLRISRALHPLPVHVFTVWVGKTSTLHLLRLTNSAPLQVYIVHIFVYLILPLRF